MSRIVSRGDVFYVRNHYDSVGSEQQAGRPAVIVSNDSNNKHSEVYEVCYFTTKDKTPLPTHVGVTTPCKLKGTILCEQVTSVSSLKLGDYICSLNSADMEAVDRAIAVSLGLTDSRCEGVISRYETELVELHHFMDEQRSELARLRPLEEELVFYRRAYNELVSKLAGVRE